MAEISGGGTRTTARKTYHRKTTLGCKTCRKRRVKCDVGRPECKNCIRIGQECSFRTFDPLPRSIASQTVPCTTNSIQKYASPSRSLPIPSFLNDSFLKDSPEGFTDVLRSHFTHLLHHFAAETSATISHDAMAQSAWCVAVPQLASKYRFVVQGIFATTALHLSRTVGSEGERRHFQNIAAMQMNAGLAQYRKTIENVTEENAAALFSFSATMTTFVLRTTIEECNVLLQDTRSGRHNAAQNSAAIQEMVRAMFKMMTCFRGALFILVPCWHSLVKGPLGPIMERDWWPRPIPVSPQALEEEKNLSKLQLLWQRPGRRYEYWFDTLDHALKRLQNSFAVASQLTSQDGYLIDASITIDWPVQCSQGFISLLEQKQPEAWIILAHYAILPSRVRKIWWIEGFASSLISTAALVIGEKMWNWIEWPALVVGVELRTKEVVQTIPVAYG